MRVVRKSTPATTMPLEASDRSIYSPSDLLPDCEAPPCISRNAGNFPSTFIGSGRYIVARKFLSAEYPQIDKYVTSSDVTA